MVAGLLIGGGDMLECLILGDSIAIGIHQYKEECALIAKSGINSRTFIKKVPNDLDTELVIISIGANDHESSQYEHLKSLRQKLSAKRVIWILPNNDYMARAIGSMVAQEFDDYIIDLKSGINMSPDSVHPTGTGYKELSNRIGELQKDVRTSR